MAWIYYYIKPECFLVKFKRKSFNACGIEPAPILLLVNKDMFMFKINKDKLENKVFF